MSDERILRQVADIICDGDENVVRAAKRLATAKTNAEGQLSYLLRAWLVVVMDSEPEGYLCSAFATLFGRDPLEIVEVLGTLEAPYIGPYSEVLRELLEGS